MTLTPGTKLGPYELIAPIGSGGMGDVWKARDTRLGRVVAIKKVKEQHSERFKQEARSIAALNHPNICQLFDIGEDYLVLEYVEGKPLSCPLPEREAVRLGIQIAAALEAAHKKGIIHRDLKPGNIMVTDEGSVKLLDFGLAKLYEQAAGSAGLPGVALAKQGVPPAISTSPTADYPATQTGAVLGTLAYMSPEQAQGQPADARSDLFSFGLVLYEMLSGRRAFSGNSNYAIMNAIVKNEPPQLQTSPWLEKIVRRCLAKQPSGRYQTISDVKTALEQTAGEKATAQSAEPQQPSIAVLPFVNMSGDKEQEYFSDGLAEEIINALTQIPGLLVIARTSAFAFKGKQEDITKIAEALRVSTILEGSVRKAGNRIRVTAQLIDASKGIHLWSQRYDRDLTDIFAIQDEISQAIAEKLRFRGSVDRPIAGRHKENVEAYNLYLKGHYHLVKYTPESLGKGKEHFEQAIAMDPNCASAWYGLAVYHELMGFSGLESSAESRDQWRLAGLKALEIDERLPQAHSIMGALYAVEFDWENAERQFRRALELGPEAADVPLQYCFYYLTPTKRFDEAIAILQRAVRADPVSPQLQERLGCGYLLMRRWDRAIIQFQNALELDPKHWVSHMFLGFAQQQMGKLDEGIRACETALKCSGKMPMAVGFLGGAYAKAGRTEEASRLWSELEVLAQKAYVPPFSFALISFGLGNIDRCFDWLDKAVDQHDQFMLQSWPTWHDLLASHPRCRALLRKMNLDR